MKSPGQIKFDDYRIFFKEYYSYHKRTDKIIICAIVIILTIISCLDKGYPWYDILTTILIVAFVILTISFAVPYTIAIMRLELQGSAIPFDGYTIDVNKAVITVTEHDRSDVYDFSNVKKIYSTENYTSIWLYNKVPKIGAKVLLVHKVEIDADSEINQLFYNTLNRGYQKKPKQNLVKIPYALGLLGIIPFVGAVNGVIMIIMGLTKFKDALYVMIGALGLLFTLAIVFMFHSMKPDLNSKIFNTSFSVASRNKMNGLVKNIEFYKLQHSEYPDSLQQLKVDDSTIDIYDPIFTFKKSKEGLLFNYRKIGHKYTLYSSGIDLIPHTADDIYPNVHITDTSKMGFVKADTIINLAGKHILKTE